MSAAITLGVPSKGRLREAAQALFARAGLTLEKSGHERGYRGRIRELDDVDVAFLSAAEIAHRLHDGELDAGVTGEDLLREHAPAHGASIAIAARLGFGRADVVVAVPECWLDVWRMIDLEAAGALFHKTHGRRLRVATKYVTLTRGFFAGRGVSAYRIVESLGATEGAPAAGAAEVIVDITSTGSTLRANHLKVLDDGIILKSEACLACSRSIGKGSAGVIDHLAGRLRDVL